MQCINTLTTGVMFPKHPPHSCVSQNVMYCKSNANELGAAALKVIKNDTVSQPMSVDF